MQTQEAQTVVRPSSQSLVRARLRLNDEQREQIARQIEFHEGAPFTDVVSIGREVALRIDKHVMRPMSSRGLANWLSSNPHVVKGKTVIDVGTGSGIQAIACALNGARLVRASDITQCAVECAAFNVTQLGLESQIEVIHSDLLLRHQGFADVIVFAQPFFGDDPITECPVTVGMLDPGVLVPRFLEEARERLAANGVLLMMAWTFAGTLNDPRSYSARLGWEVEVVGRELVSRCQDGEFDIIALRPRA